MTPPEAHGGALGLTIFAARPGATREKRELKMSDKETTGGGFQVSPDDVSISDEGKVEIVNEQLAEAVKVALKKRVSPTKMEDSNTYACGANIYQCGKATAAGSATPVRVVLK